MPVVAFVALAAIGLIAAGMNSGPHYEAYLSVPGMAATDAAQGAQGQDQQAQQRDDGSQDPAKASEQADGQDAGEGGSSEASEAGLIAVESAIDLAAIPGGADVATFSATDVGAPAISQAALEPIGQAYAQLTDGGIDAGFVFMSLESGRGIAANVDKAVYGASSIKAPFVTYVCEELIEEGDVSGDTKIRALNDNFASNGSASVDALITSTITQSSNGAFGSLRKAYGGSDYAAWLSSLGVDDGIHRDGDWFAWYSARDAAKLWTEVYGYLQSGTETSAWLKGLLEDTNVSYIRDGASTLKVQLAEQDWEMPAMQSSPTKLIRATADSVSGYQDMGSVLDGVEVANKAGWCVSDAGSSVDYDSTSDNGIVTIDGQDYLLCIMSGAPYNERNAGNVTALASSLIAVYGELAA